MSSKIIKNSKQFQNVNFNQIVGAHIVGALEKGGDSFDVEDDHPDDDPGKKAELIIKEALDKAAAIEEEAYRKGYQEGLDIAHRESAGAVSLIQTIADTVLQEKWRLINDFEDNIVSLAVETAEKIVGEQIKVSPEVVLNNIRKSLMMATERENLVIRVSPEDLDVVKAGKDNIMSSMDGIRKIEIIADRRVGRGGCIIETGVGNVDARIQSQLNQVEQAMRGVVGHG